MLHLRLHRAVAERKRCLEELLYLPGDAKRASAFTFSQLDVLNDHLSSTLESSHQSVALLTPAAKALQAGLIFRLLYLVKQQLQVCKNFKNQCSTLFLD